MRGTERDSGETEAAIAESALRLGVRELWTLIGPLPFLCSCEMGKRRLGKVGKAALGCVRFEV